MSDCCCASRMSRPSEEKWDQAVREFLNMHISVWRGAPYGHCEAMCHLENLKKMLDEVVDLMREEQLQHERIEERAAEMREEAHSHADNTALKEFLFAGEAQKVSGEPVTEEELQEDGVSLTQTISLDFSTHSFMLEDRECCAESCLGMQVAVDHRCRFFPQDDEISGYLVRSAKCMAQRTGTLIVRPAEGDERGD
jgi:hypothetical protein